MRHKILTCSGSLPCVYGATLAATRRWPGSGLCGAVVRCALAGLLFTSVSLFPHLYDRIDNGQLAGSARGLRCGLRACSAQGQAHSGAPGFYRQVQSYRHSGAVRAAGY